MTRIALLTPTLTSADAVSNDVLGMRKLLAERGHAVCIFADSTNFSEATVVTLYLLPSLNVRLLPKLRRELRPGTRILSNSFPMGEWEPEKTVEVDGRTVLFWTMPGKLY